MRATAKGTYPKNWTEVAELRKQINGYKCERCKHPHDPGHGYTLTVHHLDGDKSNCQTWNLAALCQKCHLHIQSKVFLPQFYMFEHSDWFKPHLEGYLESIKTRRDLMYNLPKCPYCRSMNIYPQAKLWFCKDCGKDFDQAMVEQEPPKVKEKGGKK